MPVCTTVSRKATPKSYFFAIFQETVHNFDADQSQNSSVDTMQKLILSQWAMHYSQLLSIKFNIIYQLIKPSYEKVQLIQILTVQNAANYLVR